jgi:hypothetical protein
LCTTRPSWQRRESRRLRHVLELCSDSSRRAAYTTCNVTAARRTRRWLPQALLPGDWVRPAAGRLRTHHGNKPAGHGKGCQLEKVTLYARSTIYASPGAAWRVGPCLGPAPGSRPRPRDERQRSGSINATDRSRWVLRWVSASFYGSRCASVPATARSDTQRAPLRARSYPYHTPCFAYSGSAIPAEQNFQSTLLRSCGWEPCAKAARNRLRHPRRERMRPHPMLRFGASAHRNPGQEKA